MKMGFKVKAPGRFSFVSLLAISLLSLTGLAASDLRLVDAVRQGDKDSVRALLKQHADVNAPQPDGATALAWAAYRDDLETADLLLTSGANVNAPNEYGFTPLSLACINRSAAMVDRLLKGGASVNATAWTGETALMRCARTGNLETVKSLLSHGADVNAKETRQGDTALMWALAQKHADVARTLVDCGADVNARAKSGYTPLMFAVQQGDMDSTKMLLAAGAKINEVAAGGDTALLVASASGHEALSIFLLDQGANPNATDDYGFTPLHLALMKGVVLTTRVRVNHSFTFHLVRPNMVDLVKALLAHGANPNAQIKKANAGDKFLKFTNVDPPPGSVIPIGVTPFMMAAATFDADTMRILAAGGANPLLSTVENITPLMVAAGLTLWRSNGVFLTEEEQRNSLEATKVAVELGNDVNASDSVLHLTALHGAAFSGQDAVAQYLIEKGADINAKDIVGHTPLHKAMNVQPPSGVARNLIPYFYRKSTAELLLKLGATPVTSPVAQVSGAETVNATK